MTPKHDTLAISAIGRGSRKITIDQCTQYELSRDLTGPSEARFELGDDGAWADLEDAIAIGTRFQVQVNGAPWVTGRLLTRALAVSSSGGSTIQLSIRSRLADAMFASCNPQVRPKDTLKALVIGAYETLGMTADDISFIDVTDRELSAGLGANGDKDPQAREKFRVMFPDEAKVHPPETVFQYTSRHLDRFGLTQWDLPDGRIAIGAPDDLQSPSFYFHCHRRNSGKQALNNIVSANRMEDYEGVPEKLTVCGYGAITYSSNTSYKFTVTDPKLLPLDPPLNRRVLVLDPAINRDGMGEMRARKEMAQRSRQKDAYQIETADWSQDGTVYDVNTVADVQIDTAKVPGGAHLIWRVELSGNAQSGHMAKLATVARGIWRLS